MLPGHIIVEQASIETERGAELEGGGVGGDVEASGPEVCHQSFVVRGSWFVVALASGMTVPTPA